MFAFVFGEKYDPDFVSFIHLCVFIFHDFLQSLKDYISLAYVKAAMETVKIILEKKKKEIV